ncbi:hypothetical protein ABZ883_42165 [Streptomyces sp. NPDC046977]|uniref:hypothetical protein n=1 Tax=Streptomyces sp. NPDC046977 TaxID=3154703 RepID=UPI003402CA60
MSETELMAIATGAAGTIAAAMATSGALAIRDRVATLFHRGTAAEQSEALDAVDRDAASLADGRPVEQVTRLWAVRIASYLAAHPEAVPDATRLAQPPRVDASQTWHQHNTGRGTFIGRDVHGGITSNHNGPSDA